MLHMQWQLPTISPYLSFLHTVLGRLLRPHKAAVQAVNVERSPLSPGHAVSLKNAELMCLAIKSGFAQALQRSTSLFVFVQNKHCVSSLVAALAADLTQPFFCPPGAEPKPRGVRVRCTCRLAEELRAHLPEFKPFHTERSDGSSAGQFAAQALRLHVL